MDRVRRGPSTGEVFGRPRRWVYEFSKATAPYFPSGDLLRPAVPRSTPTWSAISGPESQRPEGSRSLPSMR
jgi:hypothetical protein